MAIDGVGGGPSYLGAAVQNIRSQLDVLQQQLASGKKSDSYAGMGVDRSFGISLRTQLSNLASYSDTMTNANLRINIASSVLGRMVGIGTEVHTAASNGSVQLNSGGQTSAQQSAQSSMAEMIQLLNTQAGDRYLFSGRAVDQPATASVSDIMDGIGSQAGLKQLIAERKQADLGASGLGRLVVSAPTATSVGLTEDAPGSPFGLKLCGVTSTLTGATVTGPAGSPAGILVDLGATNPQDGDKIQYTFTLPDGSTENIELTASSTVPPPAGTFGIGATSAATAANLQGALTTAIGKLSSTSLVAASAIAASNNFFNSPPLRVSGAPLTGATSLTPGTSANTVSWYTGEDDGSPARGTAVARIDQSLTVQYGARADEQGIRQQLQNIAVFAAVTNSASDPNAGAIISALNQRVSQNLATTQSGQQSITSIQADMAGAQATIKSAGDRQTQTKSVVQTMLDQIEGVSDDEVAAKIMALQTSLQASYQTTSILHQLSLVNYITP